MTQKKYFLALSLLFLIEFIVLAISPYDRADWALENALVLVLIVLMGLSYRYSPLPRLSYSLIFVFICLHEVGAHYTYARVPYDDFLTFTFNFSLNDYMGWQRNHFDRLLHFLYGLLLFYPIREILCRAANLKGFWSYFLPMDLTMSSSMIFELFEWGAAVLFGGDLGIAYLGTQGDVWDAHKDMALANLGALIAMSMAIGINMRFQAGFREEWKLSPGIKAHKTINPER